jgi:mono/diheme cytochrome c family protein
MVSAALVSRVDAQNPVERGKYLVEVIGACGNCHTPKGPNGDLAEKHLAGGFVIEEAFGKAVGRNITQDKETGIGSWTDQEIIRAIREGKAKDGSILGPPMPFPLYQNLSDNDVKAMVAYLRTVKPVKNEVPKSQYKIPLPPAWGPPVGSVPDPPKNNLVKYGEYLAGPVAHCAECHTPQLPGGRPDETKFFAGGFPFRGPYGVSYSSNLPPDKGSGIGNWTDEQLRRAINGVRPDGRTLLPPMPWPYYAGKIADGDMKAMIAYLRSLKPIQNKVPAPEPPKR